MSLETSRRSSVASWPSLSTRYPDDVDSLGGNGVWFGCLQEMFANRRLYRFFLVEGIITIAFGITIWFVLPDCKPYTI